MIAKAMFQVDAFSDRLFGGNPAAVILLDIFPPPHLMQRIAEENNLSETAFVVPCGDTWQLRWFTPVMEADFCGHATLATAHVLFTEFAAGPELRFTTRVGPLLVRKSADEYTLDLPTFPPEILDALPAPVAEIFPCGVVQVFRNFENIFVELASEEMVRNYDPPYGTIASLGTTGLGITAQSVSYDFVSRYFAPGSGIPEDPVTGSAHATLVPYWADRLSKSRLRAYQASPRGGELSCELRGDRVWLTGAAVTYMKAQIFLPLWQTDSPTVR
jgi:predicted PhzF superfamily epimerase YddE/YHI9